MSDMNDAQRAIDEALRQARRQWGEDAPPDVVEQAMEGIRPALRREADRLAQEFGRPGGHFVLEGHTVREVPLLEWARWFETADRRVAYDVLPDGTEISTVFLGIDHNYHPQGPPLIFETMTFPPGEGREDEQLQRRYTTWPQAEAGHREVLEEARRLLVARRLVDG